MTLQLLFAALVVVASAADLAENAQQKIDVIQSQGAAPGSVITFTVAECNAWAHARLPELVPSGIRNEILEFGADTVTGAALVNFLAIREGMGLKTGALLARMLEGERPLKAMVRVVSANGQATIYLTRLEVGGAVMSGTMLNILIDDVLRTVYPNAKVNQPIQLDYGIERIEVRSTGIRVAIKR